MYAYMGIYVHTWGICVSITCAVQLAVCDCKYPESAHLSASHSLPTVSDLRNSFFSAFGTSKIGGGVYLQGGLGPHVRQNSSSDHKIAYAHGGDVSSLLYATPPPPVEVGRRPPGGGGGGGLRGGGASRRGGPP